MAAVVSYVALGANLGNREDNIHAALAKLERTPGVHVTKASKLFEFPAVGGPPDSPPFLNAAAELTCALDAPDLLQRLLEIERELGRVRREKWGPRPIDLDLLLFGELVQHTPGLTVPHPLMHERRFVLDPLVQIAPEVVHPVLKRTIRSLHDAL